MNFPQIAKPLKANDAKLGGKYRMSNIRGFIALAYLLYVCSGKKSSVDYSNGENRQDKLQLNTIYLEQISDFLEINLEEISNIISENPLLSGQFEYILVAMERVFCLGSLKFNDSSYNNSKERTGGIRFPKTLLFSTNMFVLDLIISGFEDNIKKASLYEWLQSKKSSNSDFEKKVTQFLTICSQYSLFRTRTSETEETIYRSIGIYEQLRCSGEVSIIDSKEQAGTSSIYNNVLKEELNPWLDSKRTDKIRFNANMDISPYLEMLKTTLDIVRVSETDIISSSKRSTLKTDNEIISKNDDPFVAAIRTKPFLLLAGISGTGKSQKVQELAFMTCPKGDLRNEGGTTPGNYCLIEVKPNWHDSTELLGYYSALSGKYELTDFIRFVYKAIQNENTPFFLCLDEMNLAPVEQYFAEFLSVLETRKKVGDKICTQHLLSKDRFSNCDVQRKILVKEGGDIIEDDKEYKMEFMYSDKDAEIIKYLKENGLSLPDNLFVIGTVNMDDTTHQFSRKVIDRAFTIEMNGGEMSEMFADESRNLLEYRDEPIPLNVFKSQFVRAYEVFDDERFSKYKEKVSTLIPKFLGNSDGTAEEDSINGILNNTPFRVSYRVQNELVLYLSTLIEKAKFPNPDDIDGLINEATLAILLEKILPRIQGEHKQLETRNGSNVLRDLKGYVENHFKPTGDANEKSHYHFVLKKLEEMDKKLDNYYTNFF